MWVLKDTGERSPFDRVAFCGTAIGGLVGLVTDGATVWPTGVASCGSVWLCPVCSAKIKTRRAAEIEDVCQAHESAGGSFSLVTCTVRHDRTMSLNESRGAVARSWGRVQRLKSWADIKEKLVGQIAAPEITFGRNGWHPHLHILLLIRAGVLQQEIDRLKGAFVADWLRLVSEELGVMPSVERGVDFSHIGKDGFAAAGRYLSKIANELTASDLKSGRDPFALLDDVGSGDSEAIAKWFEFSRAMKGVRSVGWSVGLRDLYDVGPELSDEAIAEEDQWSGQLVAMVTAPEWNAALKRGRVSEILELVEVALDADELDLSGSSPPLQVGFRSG